MKIISLDPRVNRAKIDETDETVVLDKLDQFQTYEAFVQSKRGTHHVHVGSVHAANERVAMLFAKEQYARRGECVNIWVVKTADISATEYEDSDIFETLEEKTHRNPESYKVMDRIKEFKERSAQ